MDFRVKCEISSRGGYYTFKSFHMAKISQIVALYKKFEKLS